MLRENHHVKVLSHAAFSWCLSEFSTLVSKFLGLGVQQQQEGLSGTGRHRPC